MFKTKQQCKDEFAISKGYYNWASLVSSRVLTQLNIEEWIEGAMDIYISQFVKSNVEKFKAIRIKGLDGWLVRYDNGRWATRLTPDLRKGKLTMDEFKDAVGRGIETMPCEEKDLEFVEIILSYD